MTKKKGRQTDPGSPGDDASSESGDDYTQTGAKSCPHICKSLNKTAVRKKLKAGLADACADCLISKPTSSKEEECTMAEGSTVEQNCPSGLWLCLQCGYHGCGPLERKNSHIVHHQATPRSDCHALIVNSDQWNVWCSICATEIAYNSTKNLQDFIAGLKKQSKSPIEPVATRPKNLSDAIVDTAQDSPTEKGTPKRSGSKTVTLTVSPPSSSTGKVPLVKGLTNLGNTCFFNAVLQCLAQTPYLVPLLKENAEGGGKFFLPGTKKSKHQEEVPPLEGTLGKCGQLTEVLAETLEDMQKPGGSSIVTPKHLLNVLSFKAPHLSQGDQQDSQELLRHLMEGVRSEELKRYQECILNSQGLSRKTDPSTVDECTKAKAKVYSHQATQLLLKPDQLFQGRLISILQCQECYRQSFTSECFLDLSLPIVSDRPQPPLVQRNIRKENKDADSEVKDKDTPSKYQLKKERRKSQKNRKRNSRQNSLTAEPSGDNQNDGNKTDESKQSDADVEDNEEQDTAIQVDVTLPKSFNESKSNNASSGVTIKLSNEDRCGGESGYATNGGTHSNSPGSPTSATEELETKHTHASALCSELQTLALNDEIIKEEMIKEEHKENSALDSKVVCESDHEEKVDLPEKECKEEEEEEGARALTPEPDSDENYPESSYYWNQTLTPKTTLASDSDGECSIQSCLNQFTAIELLTGNNKVSCKTCTQRAGKPAQGKSVYSNATKQFLVSAPPAILTLHLKRFEGYALRFRKVGKNVSFPLILDLAPICSKKCLDLPSVRQNQNRILYSLYGVVEHSGMLSGGHYVAYVKSRNLPDKNDPKYKFLLFNSGERDAPQTELTECDDEGAEGGLPEPPASKWYYISDSRVSEISEERVLQKQAYLLFYERIL